MYVCETKPLCLVWQCTVCGANTLNETSDHSYLYWVRVAAVLHNPSVSPEHHLLVLRYKISCTPAATSNEKENKGGEYFPTHNRTWTKEPAVRPLQWSDAPNLKFPADGCIILLLALSQELHLPPGTWLEQRKEVGIYIFIYSLPESKQVIERVKILKEKEEKIIWWRMIK
jgi:hypothetical protein